MRESGSVTIRHGIMKAALGLLLAILLGVGYNYLKDPQHFPVRVVKVTGKLTHTSQATLQSLIAPYVADSVLAMDIIGLRTELSTYPWIQGVQVKRIWPDTVSVEVAEHQPVAYWGDESLVSDKGERFTPRIVPALDLPHWEGPPDELVQVIAMHAALERVLAPKGVHIARLTLNARWAWQVVLSSGLTIELGSHDVVERLARFVTAAPMDVQAPVGVHYVDLRYTNGFVVNSNK